MSANDSMNEVSDGLDLNENPRVCQVMDETLTKPSLDQGSADDSGSKGPIEVDSGEVRVFREGKDQNVCECQIEALFGDLNSLDGDGDASAVYSNVPAVDGNSNKEAGTMDSVKDSRNNEIESVDGQSLNVSVDDQRTGRKAESMRGEDQETGSSVEEAADLQKIDVAEAITCVEGDGGTMNIDFVGAGESMVGESSAKQIGSVGGDSSFRDGDRGKKYTVTEASGSTIDVHSAERIEIPVVGVAKQIDVAKQIKVAEEGVTKEIEVLEKCVAKEIKGLEECVAKQIEVAGEGGAAKQIQVLEAGIAKHVEVLEEQIEVLEGGVAKQITVSEGFLTERTKVLDESGTKKVEVLEEGVMQVETANEFITSSQEVHVTGDDVLETNLSVSDKKQGSSVEGVDLDSSKGTKVIEVGSSGSVKDQATGIESMGASSSGPKNANNGGTSCADEDPSIVDESLPIGDANTEKSQNIGTQETGALTNEKISSLPDENQKMEIEVTERSSSLQNGDRLVGTQLLDENMDTDALVGVVCGPVPNGGWNSGAEITELSASQPGSNEDSGAQVIGSSVCQPSEGQPSSAQITEILSRRDQVGEAFPASELDASVPEESENAGAQVTETCAPVLGEDRITGGQVLESGICPPDGYETAGICVMEVGVLPRREEQSGQTQSTSSVPAGARSQVSNVGISLPSDNQHVGNLVIDLGTSCVDENLNSGDEVVNAVVNGATEIKVTEMRSNGEFSCSVENQSTGTEATEMVNDGNQTAGIEAPIYAGKDAGNPDLVEQATTNLDIQDLSKSEEKQMEEVAKLDCEKPVEVGTVLVEKETHASCSQSQEDQFSSADLVWGKVKSHPWWPGQIFDPSDSSEKAKKYQKKDSFLVAYFGDRTFAWCEKSQLKPFRANFAQMEKQSNSDVFLNAVDSALDEVSRRVELGLACSCLPESAFQSLKSREVVNAGIREGVTVADSADKSLTVTSFEHNMLLGYINLLAMSLPSGGVDRLELTIAQAQLTAYYRAKGYSKLPLFHVHRGLSEHDGAEFSVADRTCLENVVEHSTPIPVEKDQISSGLISENGGVESRESPSRIRKHIFDDSLYHSRKQKSLIELMAGKKTHGGRAQAGKRCISKSVSPSVDAKKQKVHGGRARASKRGMSKSVSPSVGAKKQKVHGGRAQASKRGIGKSVSPSVGAKKQKTTRDSFSSGSLRNKKKRHSLPSDADTKTPTTRRSFKGVSSSADYLRNRKRKRLASLNDADTMTPIIRRSLKEGSFSADLARNKKKRRVLLSDVNTETPTIQRSLTEDSISADSVRNRKRKRLASLSDTNVRTPTTRGSFKVGDCISRIANQLTGSPLILKFSRESSRKNVTKAERTRASNRAVGVSSVSPQLTGSPPILKFSRESSRKNAIKVAKSRSRDKVADVGNVSPQTPENQRKISIPKENSSKEMLSQLCLTARDPMKGYNFLSAIISFFVGFRNSANQDDSGSGSRKNKKSLEKMRGKPGRKKMSNSKAHCTETFKYDDVKDSYWTDRIIYSSRDEPLQRTRKRRGESKLVSPTKNQVPQISLTESKLPSPAKKRDPQSPLNPSRKPANSSGFSSKLDPEQEPGARKQVGNLGEKREEGSSPTALILTFNEGDSLPSAKDLCKIFSRYGPLKESETEVLTKTNRARVIFKRRSDAEVAFSSAGKFSIFGPALVSYRLSYVLSPSKTSPAKPSLPKASPTKLSPANASPMKPSLFKASPTKLSPAKASPTKPSPSKSKGSPTKPSPSKSKASPTKPSPSKAKTSPTKLGRTRRATMDVNKLAES